MIRSLIPTLGIAALFTVYSSGQLIGMLDLGALDVIHILIGITLLIFILSPIKFLIYTLNTRYQRPDRIRQVLWGVIILLALAVGIPGLLAETFYIGMFSWLGSPYFEFFPFIGWSRGLISYLFEQNLWRSAAFLGVYSLSFIGLIRLVIHFAGDYYEDVLETTKANEETQEKVKTRQAQSESAGALAAKKKVDVPLFGTGAQAIYWRNYVGNIRTDYHPYFGLYSLGVVGISWIIALGSRFLGWDHQILYFYIFAIYTLYGLGGLGKTNVGDLKKHYFYLLPASWNAKMWNLLKIDVVQCLLVGGLMAVGAVLIADLSWFLLLYVPLAMVALYLSVLSISLITQIGVKESWDRKFIKSGITLALFSFGLLPAFGIAFFLYIISNQAVYGFLGMGVWLSMVALILLNAAAEMIEKRELHEVG
ncbi:hypothetical protein A3SI_12409 [Nitritalea halalkaliphila LW7]|uniref:ABC exporter n=1 Tax=Nitritalea halalkaliphila LW7 TaxID=1189621 RepID=I5C1P3_9BACT|nr:hypothetical protein A3SI_12409 [Nitritalea halalkaliphila LW7]